MATSQSFLNGMRASAGFGLNYTRPSVTRSADQNNTISGNPGYSTNMPMPPINYNRQPPPMSWQQMVMARQQQQQQLAQDPTNINYVQPQQNSFGNAAPLELSQWDPRGAPTPQMIAQLRAQQQLTAGNQINNSSFAQRMMNGGNNVMPNVNFTQPRPVMNGGPNGVQQLMMMGNGGPNRVGGSPIPRNLAAGPSGYRFVRPMVR